MSRNEEELQVARFTRHEVLKSAGVVVGGMGVLGLISGCGGSSGGDTSTDTTTTGDAGKPKRGGVLTIAMSVGQPTEVLDPARMSAGNENLICGSVFDRLCRFNNNFEVRPELAESWTSNADGTTWTFKLRPGLKFSDGSPLTTADVESTVQHILDPKVGSSHLSVLAPNLKPNGIEVVDDVTIRFKLYSANGLFPLTLGDKYVGIVKKGTADDERPIGAGPFMIEAWSPGQSWNAVRNPHYWQKGLPYLDGFRGSTASESSALVRSLVSGSADLVGPIDFGQAQQVKTSTTKLLEAKNGFFIFAVMDSRIAPFDDPRVTQAVKIAVNRQAIVNSALGGYANATTDVLLWPGNPGYPADLGVREQDIEQAKSLLTDAGHADGIDLELYTSSVVGGMVDFATTFAQIVQPAGIRIKIKQANPATYFTDVAGKRAFFVNFTAARQPLYAIQRFFVSDPVFPFTGFSNPQVDSLTKEAFASVDDKKRNELTAQANQIIADEAPMSIPASLSSLMASKNNVQGLELSGAEFATLQRAWLS